MISANNYKIRPIAVILALVLCILGAGDFLFKAGRIYAAKDATVTKLEQQIAENQKKQKETLAALNAAKANKADQLEYKAYIDEQINLTVEEIELKTAMIAELEAKIAEKENEIEITGKNIDAQYESFKQIMRLTYEEGDASYIEMVLGAEDFYDFLVRIEQVTSLMEYNQRVMKELKDSKAALEEAKKELEESKTAQEAFKAELDSDKAELDQFQEDLEGYLQTLENTINANSTAYQKYKAEEDKLDKELEDYLKELQAKQNAAYVGGEFMWPVPISWNRISSNYGYRTLFGVKEFHRGIDIPAYAGTNIYASNGGTVVTAVYHYSYGNYVVIDHGGGKSTLYAHATKLNCKKGDVVKKGDVIAFVGTTGNSTGNHLHFEVRINGTAQNPLNYVKQP